MAWEPLPNPADEPTRTLWSAVRVLHSADNALRMARERERDPLFADILETESGVAEWAFILGRWAITADDTGTADYYKIVSTAELYMGGYARAARISWELWRNR